MASKLAGKSALITGGETGIGRALAHRLAGEGVKILLASRDTHAGQSTAASIAAMKKGDAPRVLPLDLQELSSVQEVTRIVRTELDQQINILCNNAAVFLDGWNKEVYDRTLNTNYKGHIDLTLSLMDHLAPNSGIVLTSSGFAELEYLTPDYVERITSARSLEDLWERCKDFNPNSPMGRPEVHEGKLSSFGTAVPAYKISKAMINKAVELLEHDPRLTSRAIKITAADPGWCRTTMGGPDAARSPEEGADSIYQGIMRTALR